MSTDEFPPAVVRSLELAAGTRCSAPFCRQDTTGADAIGDVVRIGVAAHITAKSPKGPRYDASLSSTQRKSPSNGIWMCQDHARLIDVEDPRYPPELLREWKRLAEQRPLAAMHGDESLLLELPSLRREVPIGEYAEIAAIVGQWVLDIGLSATWGSRHAEAIAALAAEILTNARQHSSPPATSASLVAGGREVSIECKGSRFGLDDWRKAAKPGGGSQVLGLVLDQLAPSLTVTHTYRRGVNSWNLALHGWPDDGCSWDAARPLSHLDLARLSECSFVRLRVGGVTLMMSWPRQLLSQLAAAGISRVVVTDVADAHFLANALKEWAERCGIELTFLGMPGSPLPP